jgi:Fur family ferric uptake transcriptional regulator
MRHMSAEDVQQALLSEDISVGLGTVYRVLLQFEQAGLLRRANIDSGRAVFELEEGEHHDHLLCLDCGRVVEFFHPEIERLQTEIAEQQGFSLETHSLALHGRCTRVACEHRRSLESV